MTKRVLVVEDQEDNRAILRDLLAHAGYEVVEVGDGEKALSAASNGAYTVAVRDTGPGIDLADQDKIFEEFQQADSSITKTKSGTGLGLSISRRIVAMHGGRIWVQSAPGRGSTFFVKVPVNVERQVEHP